MTRMTDIFCSGLSPPNRRKTDERTGFLGEDDWRLRSSNQSGEAARSSPRSANAIGRCARESGGGSVLILMTAEETAAHLCGPPDT